MQEYAWIALVLAPVIEESVYRGAVCAMLWVALGPWPAVILSWSLVKSRQLWVAAGLRALGKLPSMVVDLLLLEP